MSHSTSGIVSLASSNSIISNGDTSSLTQPNTSSPFRLAVHEVVSARPSVGQNGNANLAGVPSSLPSRQTLEELIGYLGSAEEKLYAIQCGMIPSIFRLYDACQPTSPTSSTSSEYIPLRILLLRMLRSFCILQRGRTVLFSEIGLDKIITLYKDSSDDVRIEVSRMLTILFTFPDIRSSLLAQDRKLVLALLAVFNSDSSASQEVSNSCLEPIQQLTQLDPILDEETLRKVGSVIVKCREMILTEEEGEQQGSERREEKVVENSSSTTINITPSTRSSLHHLKTCLQIIWNISTHFQQKELAIRVGLIQNITPLLDTTQSRVLAREHEITRCVTGVLSSLLISQSGKSALLENELSMEYIAKYVLERRTSGGGGDSTATNNSTASNTTSSSIRKNSVAILKNLCEAPRGLYITGTYLLIEPDILLEVLGPQRTATIVEGKMSRGVEEWRVKEVKMGGKSNDVTSSSNTSSSSSSSNLDPIDLLHTLRSLSALLKSGPEGISSAYRILDLVTRLFVCTMYVPSEYTLTQSSSILSDTVHSLQQTIDSIRTTSQRILIYLCQIHEDARDEFVQMGGKLKGGNGKTVADNSTTTSDTSSSSSNPLLSKYTEIYSSIEGVYLKQKQLKALEEMKQKEKLEVEESWKEKEKEKKKENEEEERSKIQQQQQQQEKQAEQEEARQKTLADMDAGEQEPAAAAAAADIAIEAAE